MITPVLETRRLRLLPLSEKDTKAYQAHFTDYEIIRNLSSAVPWPYPPEGVRDFINLVTKLNGQNRWIWGLHLKEHPVGLVGCIDLWKPGKPENRGFWLGKEFQGRGLMTEAAFAVNDFAFDHLGFEKLIFANAMGNTASRRVKEKSGCTFLETRPGSFVDPELKWQEIWELTKEAWNKFRTGIHSETLR